MPIMGKKAKKTPAAKITIAERIRQMVEGGDERVWRLVDFDGMPFTAVAKTLSRLTRNGKIFRLGKGLYYRPRTTVFGPSKPNDAHIRALPHKQRAIFPAGVAAANLLGFTTQNPAQIELATDGSSLPRLIVGRKTIIHTRRPGTWRGLSQGDAALLDFLRNRGKSSELSPAETVHKLVGLFRQPGQFDRLFKVAASEPPRVQAMLGAIGQQTGQSDVRLKALRKNLNTLTRFDFGYLRALKHAKEWQAKESKSREIV